MTFSVPRVFVTLDKYVDRHRSVFKPPVLSWLDFSALASVCAITDDTAQRQAVEYLCEAGTVHFTAGDNTFFDFIVIDNQWLVQLISLSTPLPSIFGSALLTTENITSFWDKDPTYPKKLYPIFCQLLIKHQLILKIVNCTLSEPIFLVPSLLPSSPPTQISSLWPSLGPGSQLTQTGRRFVFNPHVPHNIMNLFLARVASDSHTTVLYMWKESAFLKKDLETILVHLLADVSTVAVDVRAPMPDVLSRFVYDCLTSLFADLGVKPQVFIPCYHCQTSHPNSPPYLFPVSDCENAALKGDPFLYCSGIHPIATSVVVPEFSMSTCNADKLSFSDLKLGAVIGEGSAAVVYKATWTVTNKIVAVKQLKSKRDSPHSDSKFAEFQREYNGGESNPLPFPLVLKIAMDIACAMRFLHDSTPPQIHRDLKSPNILLAGLSHLDSVVAKVADFGLTGLQNTVASEVVDNPVWLAPEVMRKGPFTTKSDVYSYGVILYEMIAREKYFGKLSFNIIIEEKVLSGIRPVLPTGRFSEPEHLQLYQLVERCWHASESLRPTFSQILQELSPLAGILGCQNPSPCRPRANTSTSTSAPMHNPVQSLIIPAQEIRAYRLSLSHSSPASGRLFGRKIQVVDNSLIAAMEDGSVYFMNWVNASHPAMPVHKIDIHTAPVVTLSSVHTDNEVLLWSSTTDGTMTIFSMVCIMYNGAYVFAGSKKGSIYVFSWNSEAKSAPLACLVDICEQYPVASMCSFDSITLCAAAGDSLYCVHSTSLSVISSSSTLASKQTSAITGLVACDGKMWSVGNDGNLCCWLIPDCAIIKTIPLHAPGPALGLSVVAPLMVVYTKDSSSITMFDFNDTTHTFVCHLKPTEKIKTIIAKSSTKKFATEVCCSMSIDPTSTMPPLFFGMLQCPEFLEQSSYVEKPTSPHKGLLRSHSSLQLTNGSVPRPTNLLGVRQTSPTMASPKESTSTLAPLSSTPPSPSLLRPRAPAGTAPARRNLVPAARPSAAPRAGPPPIPSTQHVAGVALHAVAAALPAPAPLATPAPAPLAPQRTARTAPPGHSRAAPAHSFPYKPPDIAGAPPALVITLATSNPSALQQ
ncbi:leucinerich repeat kinase [Pelomyxa schiedti]|nr:leucinerich repeat kinase [Pelomyxa schiedti]